MSSIYKGQRDKSSIDLGGLDTSYKPGRKGSIVKVQPEGGLGLIGVGMSLATIAGRGKYLWGVIGNQVTKITTRKQLSKIRSEGGNILQSTRKPAIKSIENKGTLLQKVEPTLDAIARGFNKMKVQRDRKLLDRLERLPPYTFKGKKYKPGQIDAFMEAANQTILDTPLTKRTKKIKSRRDTKGRQVTTLAEDVARVLKPKKKMTGGKVYASSIRKPKTLI